MWWVLLNLNNRQAPARPSVQANHQHRESLICGVERGPLPGQRPLIFLLSHETKWAKLKMSHGMGVSNARCFWSLSSETLCMFEWHKMSFDVEVCVGKFKSDADKRGEQIQMISGQDFFFLKRLDTLRRSLTKCHWCCHFQSMHQTMCHTLLICLSV